MHSAGVSPQSEQGAAVALPLWPDGRFWEPRSGKRFILVAVWGQGQGWGLEDRPWELAQGAGDSDCVTPGLRCDGVGVTDGGLWAWDLKPG